MRFTSVLILSTALLCILANQINNLAYVLTIGSPDYSHALGLDLRMLAGVSWAIGIELGVLISVLNGAKKQAAILAVLSCLVNILANQMADYAYSMVVAKLIVYSMSGYLLWYFSELVGSNYFRSDITPEPENDLEILETGSVDLSKQAVYPELVSKQVLQKKIKPRVYAGRKDVNSHMTSPVNNPKKDRKDIGKRELNTVMETWNCMYCDYRYSGPYMKQNRYNHLKRNHQMAT